MSHALLLLHHDLVVGAVLLHDEQLLAVLGEGTHGFVVGAGVFESDLCVTGSRVEVATLLEQRSQHRAPI